MLNIQEQTTTKSIEEMSDTEVLVAVALASSKTYGQMPQHWEWVADIYGDKAFSEEKASLIIEEKLGDEYLLDVETCKEWLITEAQYKSEKE